MNELDDMVKEARLKYTENSPIFLTSFEERVFEHAFRLGYYKGKEDGIKEGVKEICQ